MTDKLTVAIIGAGRIAGGYDEARRSRHSGVFSHAGAYQEQGKFLLRTVCEPDQLKAHHFARQWDIERVVVATKDIYRQQHDIVSLCSPDHTHYEILRKLLESGCCSTIFAEKPLALATDETEAICRLAAKSGINVVVNYQRRFEPIHLKLAEKLRQERPVSGTAHYIKGLRHIGSTMIDTLDLLLGTPQGLHCFNRVVNLETNEESYEFVLFYDGFSVAVKSADSTHTPYCYHIFEIDLLTENGRFTLNDNSRQLVQRNITDYDYGGVQVLNDRHPQQLDTGYSHCMTYAVQYLHDITARGMCHTINTPEASLKNARLLDLIEESFRQKKRLEFFYE